MAANVQFDLMTSIKNCRCGGKLIYDGRFLVCTSCCRNYCPECYGYVVAEGGCFTCINCGWSQCG